MDASFVRKDINGDGYRSNGPTEANFSAVQISNQLLLYEEVRFALAFAQAFFASILPLIVCDYYVLTHPTTSKSARNDKPKYNNNTYILLGMGMVLLSEVGTNQ